MIVAPAVDLRQGRCVQLVGGRPEEEKISLPDPVAQAREWFELGFRRLHVVDLDAALSLGDNRELIGALVEGTGAEVQAGGGVRDEAGVDDFLALGMRWVIVGTRAIDDPTWLEEVSSRRPGRLIVAADVRDGRVLRKGWTESTELSIPELLERIASLPLGGVLCTDVSREGRMGGIDLDAARGIILGTRHPVWISGGITTMEELRALAEHGAAGAVLGMSIYTGTLDPGEVAAEFGGRRE